MKAFGNLDGQNTQKKGKSIYIFIFHLFKKCVQFYSKIQLKAF
jgi:hypothetical protein